VALDSLHTSAYVKTVAEKKKRGGPPASERGRDAAKQETRDALVRAATELFSKHGLDAPSLDAICARAGFTRGAFYVHFADREELIVAVMEQATASFLDRILAAHDVDAAEARGALDLEGIIAAFTAAVGGGAFTAFGTVPLDRFLAACARSPALRRRYVKRVERTRERLAEAVRAGQDAGAVRRDVDAAQTAGLLVAVALGAGMLIELRVPFDAADHAAAVTRLLAAP
jgi:TetR/AcrR family transcriptional regulator, transcriptional repressor for nem operon